MSAVPETVDSWVLRLTTWSESHGPAIGCVVDGCPPGLLADHKLLHRGQTGQ